MKKYDVIVIGLGPAGMNIAGMAPKMGLSTLAIEDHKVGGECLNYGCIPSKSLLKSGEVAFSTQGIEFFGLESPDKINIKNPFEMMRKKMPKINKEMAEQMFEGADLILNQGKASFVDENTVEVGDEKYQGDLIFIATGTKPFVPPIPGLKDIDILTNENVFSLDKVPEKLTIIGGGAIGSEMAQAFSRLGSKVTLAQMDPHLIPVGDEEAGRVLESQFEEENITVYNSTNIEKVEKKDGVIYMHTDKNVVESDEILVATGREPVLEPLKLDNAGIKYNKKAIEVDEYNRTSNPHIYAIGDCNGKSQLSHAAMHQSMLSLMNSQSPQPIEALKRSNYMVPWSVFTKPEVAQVGLTEKQVSEKNIDFFVLKEEYGKYARAAGEGHDKGFVKVITDMKGTIHGVSIVGESASELIHEWTLAMQNQLTMFNIVMMQHSFPTLSLLNKRVAEQWMMKALDSGAMNQMMASLANN